MYLHIREVEKYFTVNILTLSIDLFLVWILTEYAQVNYVYSVAIGFIVMALCAYLINSRWTFVVHQSVIIGFIKTIIISLLVLASITSVTYIGTEYLGIHYLYSRAVASVVGGIVGYIGDLLFTYAK